MNEIHEDLDKQLKKAQEDHKRMQKSYAIAKKKDEKMQSSLDRLKYKHRELEITLEEMKQKLAECENLHSEIDRTVKAHQQQQNKAALAESAADSVIQSYLQNLLSDDELSEETKPSTSVEEQREEHENLTRAVQQHQTILTDLLKRVEEIQKRSTNN